jgi:hypothetical protein
MGPGLFRHMAFVMRVGVGRWWAGCKRPSWTALIKRSFGANDLGQKSHTASWPCHPCMAMRDRSPTV